ncbi:hypothetical protein FHS52_000045 [Erythromicrobium ramosum]|uniref:Uncharacterized protein n=1 Tax=Erythrobacter ramosus TaxID=35811 RepID=A0ABR6HTX1_9SPHN|nr:hypothetical protein [Erythrobacter ramosus]
MLRPFLFGVGYTSIERAAPSNDIVGTRDG